MFAADHDAANYERKLRAHMQELRERIHITNNPQDRMLFFQLEDALCRLQIEQRALHRRQQVSHELGLK